MTPQISQTAVMRKNISIDVSPAEQARLEQLVADRNQPSKVVWRAKIILAIADGLGTMAIMRATGKSKPCVWRWQERFAAEGVEGLLRDKTRLPGTAPLPADVKLAVLADACLPRHRAKEFIGFLKRIDRTIKKHLDLHLVVDNSGTHKTPEVEAWLAKHPRFKLHFIPDSSSWLNLVERFFAEITDKRIRRGVFKSVAELEAAIHDYLDRRNADPKPFVWTKSAAAILEKEARAKAKLDAIANGYQASESEH